jgi:hypothetical protein
MISKMDVTFYDTKSFCGIPSILFSKEIYFAGFALTNVSSPSLEPFIDETIYVPTAQYKGWKTINGKKIPFEEELELIQCKLELFHEDYHHLLKNKDLDKYYCFKNLSHVVEGFKSSENYSYIYLVVKACRNTTKNNNKCKPMQYLTKFLYKNAYQIIWEDMELTPENYTHPVQPIVKDIMGPIYLNLFQSIYAYMQLTVVETDHNIIGFEALADKETIQRISYESPIILSAPNQGNTFADGMDNPIFDFTVQLSEKVLTQKRTYTQLIDVLGDVGGLMEVIESIFSIICMLIVDILYEKTLVNNLFSFDLNQKSIFLRRQNGFQKEMSPLNQEPIISNYMSTKKIPPLDSIYNDEPSSYKRILPKKSNIESKKSNRGITIKSNKSKKMTFKINTLSTVNTRKILDKNSQIIEQNIDEKNLTNEIHKVKGNICCFYFCFCCARKTNNLSNALLDEGMNLIKYYLDIFNLFNTIYYENKIQEKMYNKEERISISDNCLNQIKEINNNLYKSYYRF